MFFASLFFFRCLIAAWILLVASCAEVPVSAPSREPGAQSWEVRRQAIDGLRRWSLYGRVAIQTERDGWSASLRWIQREGHDYLRLVGPLGQGTYELERHPRSLVVRTADNRILKSEDPDTLMRENLGWSIPVAGLHYWVRGIPDPKSPITGLKLDDQARMTELSQQGWTISVLGYTQEGDLELPAKLFLYNPRLKVRLIVQQWETS